MKGVEEGTGRRGSPRKSAPPPIHALLPFHPQGRSLHRPLCSWYAWIICQRHSWIVAGEHYSLGTNMREVTFQISQSDYWRFCLKFLLKPGKCIMQVFARRVDVVPKLLLLLACSEPWHCTFGEPALAGDSLQSFTSRVFIWCKSEAW